ncbi:MAG: DUF2330 domain-containing protein [Polyangiaceae bacterium]|nr:DUF2330 domain-containing protein [Polyangiaceae bacterium]
MLLRSTKAVFTACTLVAATAFAFAPRTAEACGGCFAPPDPPTVVSGHRMVMSVSQTQTVLWDQIQYAGDPEEFAWVLPVKPGARIEAGTSAFFEVLEAQSAVRIAPAIVDCGGGSSSGCSASFAASDEFGDGSAAPGENGGDPVEVLHQGTVGPYETVTLSTEEPGALNDWLESHGYNVDDSSQPIIDQYVAEGFDFIALRLQPGQGVKQMTPVRVVMEGGSVTLPLRMVGIGTGAQTPIVLYVIGEGRYTTQNFPEALIAGNLLSWDFATSESNYVELRDQALTEDDGRSWITAYAAQNFFNTSVFDANFNSTTLIQFYLNQALANGELSSSCALGLGYFSGTVENPCPPGEPWDSPACGSVEPGALDSRQLGCVGAEDIAVALDGLNVENVWVTRLEANLPRAALSDDLTLEAAAEQVPVNNILTAQIAINPEEACGNGVIPRTIDVSNVPGNRVAALMTTALASIAAALLLRRARARLARR